MTDLNSTPTRTCTACHTAFPATPDNFFRLKEGKFGLAARCKKCARRAKAETDRAWLERNKEYVRQYNKQYREHNRASITEKSKSRYELNKTEVLRKRKEYFENNSAARLEYAAMRRKTQRDAVADQRKRYHAARYKKDLSYTLRHRIGVAVRDALRGRRKSRTTFELLGYSLDDLKAHLLANLHDGMTEADLLAGRIHIDHIRPVSSFDITSEDCQDFKDCWALSNLQPLWAEDNLRKGAKYDPADVAD